MLRMILLNLLVWGAAAGAAAAVARVAAAPEPRPDLPAAAPAADRPTLAPPAWPDLDAFAAIADRPLFTPGRRPPATAAALSPADAPPPTLTLIGVAGRADDPVALARDAAGETLRLRAGDVVDGWTVATVAPRRLTLRLGRAEHVADLGAEAQPETAAPVRAAPGAGPAHLRAAAPPTQPRGFAFAPDETID